MFYNLPHCCIPSIHKVLRTSLAKAVVEEFYPYLKDGVNTALPPSERFIDIFLWPALCPTVEKPEKPVVMLMRDPVERFISALAMLGMRVDEALVEMKKGKSVYFIPQSSYIYGETSIYLMHQIEEFCEHAKLSFPLPYLNKGFRRKPVLNDKQLKEVREFYKDDIAIIETLLEKNPPSVPRNT